MTFKRTPGLVFC